MGRNLCSTKQKLRKGLWSPEEDEKLYNYIARYGVGCWSSVPKLAGLQRCGKSCRLRWINYLRPDLKRGMFSQEEEDLIMSLHQALGNRWAQIAAQLPGRTDNEIKNFWNSSLKKKLVKLGIDPNTHKPVVSKIETKDDRRDDYADQLQMSQSRIEHAAFNLASGKFYNYDVDPLVFLPEFQGGSLDHDQYHYYNYYPQQQRPPDYGTSQVGPSFVDPACGLSTTVAGMTTHFDVVENEGSSSAFCWDDNRDQKSGSGDFGAYVEMGAGDQNLDVFHQM